MNRYAEFPHQNKKHPCETHAGNAELINPCNQRSDEIRAECCPSQDNCEQRCSASNRSANCSSDGSKSNPQHANFNQSLALRNSTERAIMMQSLDLRDGRPASVKAERPKVLRKGLLLRSIAAQPAVETVSEQSVSAVFKLCYSCTVILSGIIF